MGLFVSLVQQQEQEQNVSPAGNLLDHIWCLVPLMAFALGATECDCAMLELFLQGSTWPLRGHPGTILTVPSVFLYSGVLTQICGMEGVNIPTGKKRESRPTRLKQSLESLKFLGR